MGDKKVLIKDKRRRLKKILLIIFIILGIILVIAAVFFSGFLFKGPKTEYVLENPLKDIITKNTEEGEINYEKVIEQGILNFNEEYINYLLIALGIGKLYKSNIGYGNPVVELVIDNEVWNSEVKDSNLISKNGSIANKDLKISISKEEAVKALLSPDIEEFMKTSVAEGDIKIQIIAGKVELASKGYLSMYYDLTKEEIQG